tara:strand:+ start:158 stop:334 length:177 start_codon:yes stop_codon:yes gene_type:complete
MRVFPPQLDLRMASLFGLGTYVDVFETLVGFQFSALPYMMYSVVLIAQKMILRNLWIE